MLRHIISVSLAMTACVTLIATKANAISFTLTPLDNLQKNPGEDISFILSLDPQNDGGITIQQIYQPTTFNPLYGIYDSNELSFLEIIPIVNFSQPVTVPRDIAAFKFKVDNPVKDGESDLRSVRVRYQTSSVETSIVVGNATLDVEPVPEPLTMFGAAAALGYGALLKRKYSKKIES